MPDLKWLDKYAGQSVEQLVAMKEEYRVDSIVLAFEQALDRKAAGEGEQALGAEERVIVAVEALEREVNNGGYHQFFVNSSREYAAEIVQALQSIGCPRTAEITQRAIDALGVEDLTDEAIEESIASDDDERDDKLSECDDSYYGAGEDIAAQLFAFIATHRDNIKL